MQSDPRRKNCCRNVPAVNGNREENPYFIVLYAIHRSAHEFLSRAACVRYSSRLSIKRLRYSVSQVLDVHCVSGGNVLFFAVL